MNFNLADNEEDVDEELLDEQEVRDAEQAKQGKNSTEGNSETRKQKPGVPLEALFELPDLTRKDKSLKEVLNLLDGEYAPVIPDAITDYYLAKNGLNCSDIKIKRLLALATQKFISDIATDAYEYSRIRSTNAVYNSSNPQVRARALVNNQQQQQQQQQLSGGGANGGNTASAATSSGNTGSSGGGGGGGGGASTKIEKLMLTTDDLSNALLEYGLNINRPDFYR